MITAEELLEQITLDDITKIMLEMGSKTPKKDSAGNLYFTTVCHGKDKYKLHCFADSKFFMCYTECGSMSLFNVLMNINGWSFWEAFTYVANFKGIKIHKRRIGLGKKTSQIKDELDFIKKHLYTPTKTKVQLPSYNSQILNMFDDYCPDSWIEEGINEEVLKHFNVKFYFNQMKAIIPQYDINGRLIGIRSRNFLQSEVDAGKKYIPITVQGLTYKYPVGFNLYGLYQNQQAIRQSKTVILFEGEKSVYQLGSFYGQGYNNAVALQGMNISLHQRDLLLDQGIENIVIAFDKQYQIEYINEEHKNTPEYKEYIAYLKKLLKVASLFINYCNVYVILCWDDLLKYKDSPIDRGKEVFEELYKERYLIENLNEIREMID